MKKSILNIGKELNNKELEKVNGGLGGVFFDTCSHITQQWDCIRRPECAWDGNSCYTHTPHVI